MKVTRKAAIRALLASAGTLMASALKAQKETHYRVDGVSVGPGPGFLVGLSFGRTVPKKPLKRCEDGAYIDGGPCIDELGRVRDMFMGPPQLIPGTATLDMDLGGFESFTFRNGDESIVITREEMWEALKQ